MSTINNPYVSIGMPVYNGEQYLREALDSILAQTFTDFELIISDNASTDNTEAICREYADRDKRIRYYRNSENIGAARNYNRTFELSTGKYFKWAAHDDLIASEFLERCVAILDSQPSVVLCYTREICIDEEGNHLRKRGNLLNIRSSKPHERFKQYHDLWSSRGFTYANQCFALIRSSELAKTPLIGSYVWSELALGAELLLLGEFYEVPEYLFFFRCHEKTSRATKQSSGYRQLAIWFDPRNRKGIILPQWRLFFQYLLSIKRVPMNWQEKVQCYGQMGRWLSWKWKSLVKELIQVAG
jgi:glycosyltransferase involved in cell wall biosynthesis